MERSPHSGRRYLNTRFRFSVLMPVHNREGYAREAIESLMSQTFKDFELIVIDDGSTDHTAQMLESYGTRIKVIRQTNQGPEVARSNGAAQAEGEYLALLDSDDLFLPWSLATYDRVIQAFDSPPVIIGSMLFFRNGQPLPSKARASHPVEVLQFRDFLAKDRPIDISNSRIVVRKSVVDEIGSCFRRSTPSTFHLDDFHILLKVGTHGPCLVVERPYTVAYRMHPANSVKNTEAMVNGLLSLVRLEREHEYPGGRARRRERQALIGSIAWERVKRAWREGSRHLALRLLRGGFRTVLAAAWIKCRRRFRKPVQPVVLKDE